MLPKHSPTRQIKASIRQTKHTTAVALAYAMHESCNRARRCSECWPRSSHLTSVLGLWQGKGFTAHLQQLFDVEEVHKSGLRLRNKDDRNLFRFRRNGLCVLCCPTRVPRRCLWWGLLFLSAANTCCPPITVDLDIKLLLLLCWIGRFVHS